MNPIEWEKKQREIALGPLNRLRFKRVNGRKWNSEEELVDFHLNHAPRTAQQKQRRRFRWRE